MHKTSRREFQPESSTGEAEFFKTLNTVAPCGARIYQIDLDHPCGLDIAHLTEEESASGKRMRNPSLQRRKLAGRAALRAILSLETGTPAASLLLTTEPAGKPLLTGHAIHFSLANTGPAAVVAVSKAAPVGIDMECTSRTTDFQGIASKFFHPCEAEWMDGDVRMNFFRLWTSKEAILKCTGEGIAHHLGCLRTLEMDAAHAVVEYARSLWQVEFLQIDPALLIAVVTDEPAYSG